MTFLKQLNAYFIHVPKNAGTAVYKALGQAQGGHEDYHKARAGFQHVKHTHPTALLFAIVRNPWDRLVSCYEYIRADSSYWHSADRPHPLRTRVKAQTFEQFVDYVADILRQKLHRRAGQRGDCLQIIPQHEWICEPGSAELPADVLILRFESLAQDMLSNFGFAMPEQRVNASRADSEYRAHYNPRTAAVVAQTYAKDIALFGYSF